MSIFPFQFPPNTSPFVNDIPVWMQFYCANYSTFAANRTRDYIRRSAYLKMSIPYPQQHNTLNSQNYQAGGSLNVRAIEKGILGNLIGEQIAATAELASSFFSGGGVLRFDHFESILSPGARRTHTFNINLVAKTEEEAYCANAIALAFQANVFPVVTNNYLTMRHPPLWLFETLITAPQTDSSINPWIVKTMWDGQPLACVLRTVDINRSPILNTPFMGSNSIPLALNIKLSFIELEPALSVGIDDNTNITSRSERLA